MCWLVLNLPPYSKGLTKVLTHTFHVLIFSKKKTPFRICSSVGHAMEKEGRGYNKNLSSYEGKH